MSMLLLASTTSRPSPVSRSIRSILSVRASHQYSFPSWQEHGAGVRDSDAPHPQAAQPQPHHAWATGSPAHLVVHGDAVGPADANVDQHNTLGAVQARSLDAGILPPLRPEQVPVGGGHESPAAPPSPSPPALGTRVSCPPPPLPHPFSGCTVMARGLSSPWEMTT